MSDVVNTHQLNGYTVQIVIDDHGDTDSPRDDDGNLGVFIGFKHRDYRIGDEQIDPTDYVRQCKACHGDGTITDYDADVRNTCEACHGDGELRPTSEAQLMAWLKEDHQARVILPVGMIDHSGVAYYIGGGPHASDSAGWDSGTCGFIMDTPAGIAEGWGQEVPTDEQIIDSLTGEIAVYSDWANGNVYGVIVKDTNGDEVESCWGFIGSEHVEGSWQDMVPSEPPPAKLYTLRLTDTDLDLIDGAILTAPDVDGRRVNAILEIIRKARA